MIRSKRSDIVVKYSTRRQPRDADYDGNTREVTVPADDGGAPWYLTGDVVLTKRDPGDPEGHLWFYLLGRRNDIAAQFGQIAGAGRGLGVEDCQRRANANDIMIAAGLYKHASNLAHALGSHALMQDVLVTDVYPVKLDEKLTIFVVSVSKAYWGPVDATPAEEKLSAWRDYIKKRSGVDSLVFAHTDLVPRTAPPLLKPKTGVMREKLQAWLAAQGLQTSDLGAKSWVAMSQEIFLPWHGSP